MKLLKILKGILALVCITGGAAIILTLFAVVVMNAMDGLLGLCLINIAIDLIVLSCWGIKRIEDREEKDYVHDSSLV